MDACLAQLLSCASFSSYVSGTFSRMRAGILAAACGARRRLVAARRRASCGPSRGRRSSAVRAAARGRRAPGCGRLAAAQPAPEADLGHLLLDPGREGDLGAPGRRLQSREPGGPVGLPGQLALRLRRPHHRLARGRRGNARPQAPPTARAETSPGFSEPRSSSSSAGFDGRHGPVLPADQESHARSP